MANVHLYRLEENSATLLLERSESAGGGTMVRSYPIYLGRAEDGSWQVYAAAFGAEREVAEPPGPGLRAWCG